MILVTGAAGFIGAAVTRALLDRGERVVGIDNMNAYYEVSLKEARLARLQDPNFEFRRVDLADTAAMDRLFDEVRPKRVIHLAAQAGVRYSLTNPRAYVDSNLIGFMNIMEGCRNHPVEHLVYASSSSVYGANTRQPFSEEHNVDHPISLYAATKKSNELMAHTYAHLFGVPTTGLRLFTVYGPWGRPDMAPFLFARGILSGETIQVFNEGKMIRDFTYIDDVVEGILRVADHPAAADPAWSGDDPNPATSYAPWRVFNIGNNQPVVLLEFIDILADCLGRQPLIEFQPIQPGDVVSTMADVTALERTTGFRPTTALREGLTRFAKWYREYYGV